MLKMLSAGRKKRRRFTCLVSFSDPAPEKASEEAIAIAERFKELKTAVEEVCHGCYCWLVARCPSSMQAYLRNRCAETVASAATLR